MNIWSIFQPKAPVPVAPVAQPNAPQQNPTIPNDNSPTNAKPGEGSPVDKFKELWKIDPAASASGAPPTLVPPINLDPVKLKEMAEGVNFTSHIPPELLQKASQGDAAALAQVVNSAAQVGFSNAIMAAGEISRRSFDNAQNVLLNDVLPGQLRKADVAKEMAAANPVFNDPGIAPMVDILRDQFARKYPQATPAELATMAKEYLGGMAGKIATSSGMTVIANNEGKQVSTGRKETDWLDFAAKG